MTLKNAAAILLKMIFRVCSFSCVHLWKYGDVFMRDERRASGGLRTFAGTGNLFNRMKRPDKLTRAIKWIRLHLFDFWYSINFGMDIFLL